MSYFNEINNSFPIRRSEDEKKKFREYIESKAKEFNKEYQVEKLNKKHNNVIVGNIDKAKVIYTAHYDTPAKSLFPNMIIPTNKFLSLIYHLGIPILYALVSLGIAGLIVSLLNLEYTVFVLLYLVIYFASFYISTRCFVNKHNFNDNTSGISVLVDMMSKTNSNEVAFIFFDNEEKGLLGSKAFNKVHKELLNDKLVINLDCVGNGNHFIVIEKEDAAKLDIYKQIKNVLLNSNKYSFDFYSNKKASSNSDYKNFKNGVGIVACSKGKYVKYYTSKIHTNKDTFVDIDNLSFLSNELIKNFV